MQLETAEVNNLARVVNAKHARDAQIGDADAQRGAGELKAADRQARHRSTTGIPPAR
jgi:hypothetical protein